MNHPSRRALLYCTFFLSGLLFGQAQIHAAWFVLFTGSAASVDWKEYRPQIFAAPTLVATLPVTHEDLSDELVLLEPENMVFTSTVKKTGPAKDVIYSAPVDKRAAGRLGGVKDRESVDRDAVDNAQENRDRIWGAVQHFRETHGVSTMSAQVMDPAGIEDAFVDGRLKKLVQIKEDMELSYLSEQEAQVGSTSLDFLTRGASMYVEASAQPNSDYAVASAFRPASAQIVETSAISGISESAIRLMLQRLNEARKGMVKISGFCQNDFASRFDDFFTDGGTANSLTPVRRFNTDGATGEYEIGITSYKTRFGKVDIIPTTYLNGVRNAGSLAGASTTNTDATVTVTSTAGLQPFMRVYGTGIPAGAYIASITNATTFELSAAATATGTPTLTLGKEDFALFLDMNFFEVKTNMVPSAYELPVNGGGRDGVVEAMSSLFCSYPAVHGKFRKS